MKPSDYIRQGWCQHTYARDAKGRIVPYESSLAVSWCLGGAIAKAASSWHEESVNEGKVLKMLAGCGISRWNDKPHRTQEDVLQLLEKCDL